MRSTEYSVDPRNAMLNYLVINEIELRIYRIGVIPQVSLVQDPFFIKDCILTRVKSRMKTRKVLQKND